MKGNIQKKTLISELGEFGLIEHLTKGIKLINPSSKRGVGDDAAVLEYPDKQIVVTTDLLLEGIHFNLMYTPLKHLGYKAAVVNFSDIYSMNARPKQIIVSLGLSKKFALEDVDALYEGIYLACKNYGVDLIGGDTSASVTGLTISITAIGEAGKNDLVYRDGARINDLICVSGDLGSAYMGLQLLEREKTIYEEAPSIQPDLSGYDYIVKRQLKPDARRDIIEIFNDLKIEPTSMIDVSDGLSSDLLHICKNSNVGCKIYQDKIPLDQSTIAMANEFHMDPVTPALHGGEDYELLFTIPLKFHDKINSLSQISLIGHICKAKEGRSLITTHGSFIELKAQGWNGLKDRSKF
jgi:thiamine-monophosphate kinase